MIKTEGIVLGEMKYKESSKILNVYTKKLGKISVMAQGAYKPKSQLISTTQPFSYCEFNLQKGRNFYYISNADLIDSFYSIRDNMDRIVYGFYILELIEKSSPDEEENEKLFLLLEKGLKVLSSLEKDYLKFIVAYELKFVSFLGYRPHINSCVACEGQFTQSIKFSKALGGVLCSNCFSNDLFSKKINHNFPKAINDLLFSALDDLEEISLDHDTLLNAHNILVDYILFNIERTEFKSLSLWTQL